MSLAKLVSKISSYYYFVVRKTWLSIVSPLISKICLVKFSTLVVAELPDHETDHVSKSPISCDVMENVTSGLSTSDSQENPESHNGVSNGNHIQIKQHCF